jgi:uncharacterized protein YbcI
MLVGHLASPAGSSIAVAQFFRSFIRDGSATEGARKARFVSQAPQAPTGSVAAAISNAAVKLLSEYTGRGPTKARTTISGDLVVILLADTMTKAEKTLATNGEAKFVLDMRHRFQLAMRDDLVRAVEVATDRKVVAFMSDNHIDPDMAAEVFVLEPQVEPVGEEAEPVAG